MVQVVHLALAARQVLAALLVRAEQEELVELVELTGFLPEEITFLIILKLLIYQDIKILDKAL